MVNNNSLAYSSGAYLPSKNKLKTDFKEVFNTKYSLNQHAFGNEPISLVKESINLLPQNAQVLDLGVGNGRNALYFLKHGFKVTGIDISENGLKLLKTKAKELGLAQNLTVVHSNIVDFIEHNNKFYDAVLGIGLLHFLNLPEINQVIKWAQTHVTTSGLNIFVVRTKQNKKGNLPYIFKPAELKNFYDMPNWEIIKYIEQDFRQGIVAKKIKEGR